MKRLFVALLAVALALAGALAHADAPIPPLKARVTDATGTLTPPQARALESSLAEFEQRKGSQIAVLIVPTTRPETIEQYSIRVADAWKIGRGRIDDGVIVVVAKNDRDVRIEVGRGLEGAIPDVIASRIIREIIVPRFKAGDFYGGLSQATQALMKLVEGEPLPAPKTGGARPVDEKYHGVFVLLLVVAALGGGLLSRVLGRGGSAIGTGGVVGLIAWALTGIVVVGVIAAMIGFVFAAFAGSGGSVRRGWGGWGGGFGGGGFSGGGGFGGGGGFSGGGGGFSGGGASGSW